jgi:MFS family permease
MLLLLSIAQVLGMSLWFSASAVGPALRDSWHLSPSALALLTSSVQLGFIVGALLSAVINLSDIVDARWVFGIASIMAGAATLAFALWARGLELAVPLRFAAGLCLSGVYPPGIKLMSSWFEQARGLAVGVLIAALSLGSALPHLIASGGLDWPCVLAFASLLAVAGGLIVLCFVPEGPYRGDTPSLDVSYTVTILRDRSLRLAILGYGGHMWELYALWTWLPTYLAASFARRGGPFTPSASLAAFAAIGVAGFAGATGGGWIADRIGRTMLTTLSMAISGACALLSAAIFGQAAWLVCLVCLVWGASVIADSAQFSVALTELSDPRYAGTALALQTGIGFMITVVTIQVTPLLASAFGWQAALLWLAVGPLLGLVAMLRLRSMPKAMRMANGRR